MREHRPVRKVHLDRTILALLLLSGCMPEFGHTVPLSQWGCWIWKTSKKLDFSWNKIQLFRDKSIYCQKNQYAGIVSEEDVQTVVGVRECVCVYMCVCVCA